MYPRNYYAVLRVPEDADPAAIRHAYRVLVHRYHLKSSRSKQTGLAQAAGQSQWGQKSLNHFGHFLLARTQSHAQLI
jgi:DnaJ-class molecular chaperone